MLVDEEAAAAAAAKAKADEEAAAEWACGMPGCSPSPADGAQQSSQTATRAPQAWPRAQRWGQTPRWAEIGVRRPLLYS